MEEGQAIVYILSALVRRGLNQRNVFKMAAATGKSQQILAKKLLAVIDGYRSYDRNDFSPLHKAPLEHSFDEDKFIALEESDYAPDCAAFLWCRWDLAGAAPHCKFYYGVFRMAERHFVEGEKEIAGTVPQFVGFRYESGNWQGPEHRFYHAQPNNNMSVDPGKKIKCAAPVPDNAPTFPLPVSNPLELVLCLVLSVLGTRAFDSLKKELLNQERANRNKSLLAALDKVRGIVN